MSSPPIPDHASSSSSSPTASTAAVFDPNVQRCQSCHSTELFTDTAAGDTICTNCGVVVESHICHLGPEWRDFDSTEDIIRNGGTTNSGNGRCGTSLVDESKYIGGLEPTSLSRHVYGGAYGNGCSSSVRGKEMKIRNGLIKSHHFIEGFFERQWKKRMDESRVLYEIKKKKEAMKLKKLRDGTSLTSGSSGGISNDNDDNDEDYDIEDQYGLAEQEHIIEMEEAQQIQQKLSIVSNKWSLDRALFLHGAPHEVPSNYTFTSSSSTSSRTSSTTNGPPPDLEAQRKSLRAQMTGGQRNASLDIYRAKRLLQGAMTRLDLMDNTKVWNHIMEMMCRYGSKKDSFILKGVSSRASNTSIQLSSLSSSISSSDRLELHKEYNKLRQIAAVGSAILYLTCKQNQYGRTLASICESFDAADCNTAFARNTTTTTRKNEKTEPFVKLKYCSKGMSEIKTLFPDFVQSVTRSAHSPQAISSNKKSSSTTTPTTTSNRAAVPIKISSSNAAVPDAAHSSSSSALTKNSDPQQNATTDKNNQPQQQTTQESSRMTDLIQFQTRKLKLSPIALQAITTLVLHIQQEQMNLNGNGTKPVTLIASVTFLICEAGGTMQTLAKSRMKSLVSSSSSSSSSSTSSNGVVAGVKRKLSMPSRQRMKMIKLESDGSESSTSGSAPLFNNDESDSTKPTPMKTEEVTSSTILNGSSSVKIQAEQSPTNTNRKRSLTNMSTTTTAATTTTTSTTMTNRNKTNNESDPSWYQWTNEQKSWNRDLPKIAKSCGTSTPVVREYYKKHLYPRRKRLLELLQRQSQTQQVQANLMSLAASSPLLSPTLLSRSMALLLRNIAVSAPLMRGVKG